MEITSFSLTRLAISPKIQFFEDILSIIDSNDAALLKVTSQATALRNRWQELSDLYITDTKNPLSQEISNLDVQRDECLLSVWLLVEGYSHSSLPAMRQAGEKLLRNISLYAASPSAFATQKFKAETNNITNLLSGWNNEPELMNAVDTLGISASITALAEVNSLFNVKLLERNAMYAAETTDTSPQKQAEALAAYYDLCKALNSLAYLTPSALYDKTIKEINALIDSADLSLKLSASHKKVTPTTPV